MKDQVTDRIISLVVVDDEKAIRNGLQSLIQRNYQNAVVLTAANGLECWEMLCVKPHIELIFADIRMPGMDGLQLCEKIKEGDLSTRVVLISGFRDFEYARQALRYGVADYLLKPVDPSDVVRLVNEHVMQASNEPELLNGKQERLIIERMRRWIHDHLHEEITLSDLSEKLHYSASYLSVLFKKETGKGFLEYLVDCRMQRAKHLLLDPCLRITDIAAQVGYTNAKAFSIAFRKICSTTPTEYRETRGINTLQHY
jgi:two-component system, response regulator YesN